MTDGSDPMRNRGNRLTHLIAAAGRGWRNLLRRSGAAKGKKDPAPPRHVEAFAHGYRRRPSFRYMI